jgi:23S rRNA pseudouridine1911/1915/1917 synthase
MAREGRRAAGWTEHRVTAEEAGLSVQELLTGPLGVSRRMIQRLTRSRGIELNRRPPHLQRRVSAGDLLRVRLAAPEEPGLAPVEMELAIAYQDDDLLVVDKPPFLLVHPTAPHHTRTLAHGVAHHLARAGAPGRVRPVHRLDRDTSGLVLFARSAHAHQRLDRELREGRLAREYLAVVRGVVRDDVGSIDAPIGAHPHERSLRAARGDGAPAVTRYRVRERHADRTLLELALETGRTHQIRVHLAHLGHPVLGDQAYGGGDPAVRRQALHAHRLAFQRPGDGVEVRLESPLPADIAGLLLPPLDGGTAQDLPPG